MGLGGAAFLASYGQVGRTALDAYDAERPLARFHNEVRLAGAAAGVALGGWGEARIGVEVGVVGSRPWVGGPEHVANDAGLGRAFVQFKANRLDDPLFPRGGAALGLLFRSEQQGLGSDHPHDRLITDILIATATGRTPFVLGGVAGTAFRSPSPPTTPTASAGSS